MPLRLVAAGLVFLLGELHPPHLLERHLDELAVEVDEVGEEADEEGDEADHDQRAAQARSAKEAAASQFGLGWAR